MVEFSHKLLKGLILAVGLSSFFVMESEAWASKRSREGTSEQNSRKKRKRDPHETNNSQNAARTQPLKINEEKRAKALYEVINNLESQNKIDEALEKCEHFLKRLPENSEDRKNFQGKIKHLTTKKTAQEVFENSGEIWKEALQKSKEEKIAMIRNALELCQKSSDLDYTPALNNLGWCYAQGVFVDKVELLKKDSQKAYECFVRAAEFGSSDGLYNLGHLFEEGNENFEKDLGQALYFYHLASLNSHTEAKKVLNEYFSSLSLEGGKPSLGSYMKEDYERDYKTLLGSIESLKNECSRLEFFLPQEDDIASSLEKLNNIIDLFHNNLKDLEQRPDFMIPVNDKRILDFSKFCEEEMDSAEESEEKDWSLNGIGKKVYLSFEQDNMEPLNHLLWTFWWASEEIKNAVQPLQSLYEEKHKNSQGFYDVLFPPASPQGSFSDGLEMEYLVLGDESEEGNLFAFGSLEGASHPLSETTFITSLKKDLENYETMMKVFSRVEKLPEEFMTFFEKSSRIRYERFREEHRLDEGVQ